MHLVCVCMDIPCAGIGNANERPTVVISHAAFIRVTVLKGIKTLALNSNP